MSAAAKALGVPVPTLRDWMNAGKVPGVHRTSGGHRWITREGLIQFARTRKIDRLAEERREFSRIENRRAKVRLTIPASGSNELLSIGEGTIWDFSREGLRIERLRWEKPYGPMKGGRFEFQVLDTRGKLAGIAGTAQVAWLFDNRKERGGALGARITAFRDKRSKTDWHGCIASYLKSAEAA